MQGCKLEFEEVIGVIQLDILAGFIVVASKRVWPTGRGLLNKLKRRQDNRGNKLVVAHLISDRKR